MNGVPRCLPLLAALAALVLARGGAAQEPRTGRVEHVSITARSLEGNLAGDPIERSVSVYLPPGYDRAANRRYPVVYMLHGFTDSDAKWFGRDGKHWIHLPTVLDRALARDDVRETIVVMPDAYNAFQGSMYSSSVTIGDWERFIAEELVEFVDRRYRTVADASGRGLAGHSMGGYGTLRIGMKRPGTYASLYALSPCCLAPPGPARGGKPSAAEEVRTFAEVASASFGTKAQLASAAAWSPNPHKPPLFLDPLTSKGAVQPDVAARWAANAPLAMVHQYVFNLKRLRAVGFDAGTGDRSIHATSVELRRILNSYGVPHLFGSYDGDHVNRVAERIETVMMPFFSRSLANGE